MSYLDKLAELAKPYQAPKAKVIFDGVEFEAEDDMSSFEVANIRIGVVAALKTLSETDTNDLDDGENYADRFDSLLVGLVDQDKDGELDDDEMSVLEVAYNVAAEYLEKVGVKESDIDALINDGDGDAAERIVELLVNVAPDGEEADLAEINGFAFDSDSDTAAFDAVYKRKVAIRNGKKTIVRKRISGRVRLSGKQKAAIKKMQRKSHSGAARRARMKSMARRQSMGL